MVWATKEILAEDVEVGMMIAVQGFWFEVISTQAEPRSDGDGMRQISSLRWSGVGTRPPEGYDKLRHGLKHGVPECQIIHVDRVMRYEGSVFCKEVPPADHALKGYQHKELYPFEKWEDKIGFYYRVYSPDDGGYYQVMPHVFNQFFREEKIYAG